VNQESEPEQSNDEFLWYFMRDRVRIYAFIHSLVHHSADAEDVFQKVSMVLWKKFHEFDRDRDFYSWACGVAFGTVQNFRRLAVHRKFTFDDDLIRDLAQQQADSSAESSQKLELLNECIQHLGSRDGEILSMVYQHEWKISSVAESMNRSVQTIHNRLNLIRKSLLDCIRRKMAARAT